MFSRGLWDGNNLQAEEIGIKCKNCGRNLINQLQDEQLNSVIAPFFLRVVLQHVGLSWIIDINKHLKLDIEVQCRQWLYNCQWYNTTIFLQLNDQIFTGFSKQDASIGMSICVLYICTTNIMYQCMMLQLVVVADYFQLCHLKKHVYHLVRLSTLFIIGFNIFKKIVITKS